jgi:hypothetical protein
MRLGPLGMHFSRPIPCTLAGGTLDSVWALPEEGLENHLRHQASGKAGRRSNVKLPRHA